MTDKRDFGQGSDGGILAFKPNGTSSGDGSVVARLLYAILVELREWRLDERRRGQ